MQTHQGLTAALAAGCKLHSFLSGGGLRVVRLEDRAGLLRGYGEHPSIEVALNHAGEDYEAGGRPYHTVYNGKNQTHYLTGSSAPSSALDAWVLQGQTFDAYHLSDGVLVVELVGYMHQKVPPEIETAAMEKPVEWEARGYRFRSEPTRFPNGTPAISTGVLAGPPGVPQHRAWHYQVAKQGKGQSFEEALTAALAAEPQEVPAAHAEA